MAATGATEEILDNLDWQSQLEGTGRLVAGMDV